MSERPQSNRLLGQLWRAAKVAGGVTELAERPCPWTYVLQGWDAFQLANAISADSAKDPELSRTFSPCASDLGLSAEERDSMGPRRKLRRVVGGATSSGQISLFSQAGAQLNLLRNCDASLKLAAAGGRCWGCFCDVATRPHFPPTGGSPRAVELLQSWQIFWDLRGTPREGVPVSGGRRELGIEGGCHGGLRPRESRRSLFLYLAGDLDGPALLARDVAPPSG